MKGIRSQRGFTQKALARKINKSTSAICSYETNAQTPPLDVLISIALALNISLDYLVGFDVNNSFSPKNQNSPQKEVLDLLFAEFTSATNATPKLSTQQILIIQKLILLFAGQKQNI